MTDLRERILGLDHIPANEQALGHFQLAVQSILMEMLKRIEYLETATGHQYIGRRAASGDKR